MRKILTLIAGTMIAGNLLAGGLVTNTNQSATWVRMPSRNASIEIDAAYFNPAGLMKLENGFHFSLSNQSIFQTRKITSSYTLLNQSEYDGKVTALVFPSVYAAFKMKKLAISAGFNIIGGGGGATYENGLPSLEMGLADLKPLVSSFGIVTNQYSADIFFEGSSVFMGFQGNVSYAINDMIAVAVGARYVSAKNTYVGHIYDIMINPVYAGNPTGAMMSAPAFFTSIGQAGYAAQTANRDVDVEKTGSGFAPILSVNLSLLDKLNIAARYEFITKMELTTSVIDSKSGGIFVDGEKERADMPASLSLGADYRLTSALLVSVGGNYYFDKSADYGHKWDSDPLDATAAVHVDNSEIIENNGLAVQAGIQYDLSEKILISGGYSWGNLGVNSKYQSDQTFANATHSIGLGGAYTIKDRIRINLGAGYVMYVEDEKSVDHVLVGTNYLPTETYVKNTIMIGVGLDLRF